MKITVTVTVREILDKQIWDEFCEEFGINPWALNEGLMGETEEFSLTKEQALKFGFISNSD